MTFSKTKSFTVSTNGMDHDIQRMVEFMDDASVGFEARWGVGRLEALAPADLLHKWHGQVAKINAAIETGHLVDLERLAHGMVRGLEALEASALALGHKSIDHDAWEYRHGSGDVFVVVKNDLDAKAMHKPAHDGRRIVTLAELVNLYHAQHAAVFKVSVPEKRDATPTEELLDDLLPW